MATPSKTDATSLRPPGTQAQRLADDDWQATRAQSAMATQIMRDADEPGRGEAHDIGRLVGDNQRELFVSCGPVEAIRQQFEIFRPEYIAIHDIGTVLSRKLLAGIAAASGRSVQKLTIRRQGYGTPLAGLEFIEWPTAQGPVLRLYTTTVDADSASRAALAITLLANSRLGAVIVGELPAHALHSALQPLQEALQRGPWPNRHLLMLPLTSASAVAAQSAHVAGHSGVSVRTTPQVHRPADAWSFISATWNHMHDQEATRGLQLPGLAGNAAATPAAGAGATAAAPPKASERAQPSAAVAAPMAPLVLRPMPSVPGPAATPLQVEDLLGDYVERLMKLAGMLACTVFEAKTARPRAHAGTRFAAGDLASQGSALAAAALESAQGLNVPGGVPELALTLEANHFVLRPLPRHPHLLLFAAVDKQLANLTLVRLQIQRLDDEFDAVKA
jgi:hypothetical protein